MSAAATAALLGVRDLTNTYGTSRTFDLAEVQIAARRYPGHERVTQQTLNGLKRRCLLHDRPGWHLTEAGRVRLEGR